jgi:holo-[acyl-carrier protein] synthase
VAVRGIGIDVVKVDRLVSRSSASGERMEKRLFTEGELETPPPPQEPPPARRAGRFAAKEAASKAIGTGMSQGIGFKHFEVLQPGGQQPKLLFHGPALARFESLACNASHLSLTHDAGLAIACVVIEG